MSIKLSPIKEAFIDKDFFLNEYTSSLILDFDSTNFDDKKVEAVFKSASRKVDVLAGSALSIIDPFNETKWPEEDLEGNPIDFNINMRFQLRIAASIIADYTFKMGEDFYWNQKTMDSQGAGGVNERIQNRKPNTTLSTQTIAEAKAHINQSRILYLIDNPDFEYEVSGSNFFKITDYINSNEVNDSKIEGETTKEAIEWLYDNFIGGIGTTASILTYESSAYEDGLTVNEVIDTQDNRITNQKGRIEGLEAHDIIQDGKIDVLEANDGIQDGKINVLGN